MRTKKIGLSLSLCIADIYRGDVSLDEVEKIITRTCCYDEEDWYSVIYKYKKKYWRKFPEKAAKIANQLKTGGKIEQPRLKNTNHFPNIAKGIWVYSENEIVWQDEK